MKKTGEVEARGQQDQAKKARKRKSKDMADESVENDEILCKEKKKRREKNSHELENIRNNVVCDSQETKDKTKKKKVGKHLDQVTENVQEKKKKKKEENHLDKIQDEIREIEDNPKEKKKKESSENENKAKKKKRNMVSEDDTFKGQKNEKFVNESGNGSLENENIVKKKKRKMEKEEKNVEDQENEKHEDNESLEKGNKEKKNKRKMENINSSMVNQETEKKRKKDNDYESENGNKKIKKQKSRKSKSKEDGTLCFVKNDEEEGLKNIIINENGELEQDDTAENFQAKKQVRSKNEKKVSSQNDDTSVEDEVVKKTKKKKKEKKQEEIKNPEKENSDASDKKMAGEEALLYLRMWKENRPKWAFKKVRQVWLLKHMFDTSKIPDKDFEVLLSYLEGLQGMARKTTISRAEAFLESGSDEQEAKGFDLERVKRLLQILI